tara:strand:- start:8177 stop:10780 length:2604 start_codon:yes stop_codon:yes gene_type:complete
MKKILILLLLPFIGFSQTINTYPWIHNFENSVGLQQDQNDFGDWLLKQGPTSSVNTGPSGDHTNGNGVYYYVESSGLAHPNKNFIVYTPTFDISQTPGKVISFWYHMYGATMGDLELGILSNNIYTAIDTISGDQGNNWKFAYYPIPPVDSFKFVFKATTGSSYTSDICIDDIMVSDPFSFVYGCNDPVSPNYDSTATINNGTCIYVYGCTNDSAANYNPWANVDDGTCVYDVECNSGQSLLEVAILLDNWPGETSWEISVNGTVTYSVTPGTYDYTQTGQTVRTDVCVPIGDTIVFTINDTYGDGIGGGSVVGSCIVTNLDCEDTVFILNPPNFGTTASSNPYVSDTCNNDTIIYGCTDDDYVEYNIEATIDNGSCSTIAIYGCIDSTAFNYDPNAHRMKLSSPCEYKLILFDAGGDSWGSCWLGVQQEDSLWQFRIDQNGIYSDTFLINFNAYDEIFLYYFEIPTPQQNAQQLDIQTIQNSFKIENAYGTIIYEGNNPWPGPNENKLKNYRSPRDLYIAEPYCGNECIDVVYGCMDTLAYNYNAAANTADDCYYNPGCTNPGYLEYYTQGFVAGVDDGSCLTLAIFGCMDSTAFNYDNNANVDNGGCIPVILGCMNPLAFNYDPLANTADTCVPLIYGCIDPTMYNYCDSCNTDDGSCEPYVFGCTDSTMFNFNPLANADNNSCIPYIYGCTDPSMLNYNPQANTENFSCIPYIYGCMDSTALNYDSLANTDNGSCIAIIQGCMDVNAWNYDPLANMNFGHDSLGCLYAANCSATEPGEPFFLNDPCYAWVIDVDPYCCENEWDSICQLTYNHCQGNWAKPIPKRGERVLIGVRDILGRSSTDNNNKLLFYIYSDGTIEKRIKIK